MKSNHGYVIVAQLFLCTTTCALHMNIMIFGLKTDECHRRPNRNGYNRFYSRCLYGAPVHVQSTLSDRIYIYSIHNSHSQFQCLRSVVVSFNQWMTSRHHRHTGTHHHVSQCASTHFDDYFFWCAQSEIRKRVCCSQIMANWLTDPTIMCCRLSHHQVCWFPV